MLATLAAIGAFLCMGTVNFFGPLMTRRTPVLTVVAISQGSGALAITVIVLILSPSLPGLGFFLVAALSGVISSVATIMAFRGGQVGPIGLVSVIIAMNTLVPAAGGIIIGERPDVHQWVGIVLAAAGTLVTLLTIDRKKQTGPEARHEPENPVGHAVSVPVGAGAVMPALGPAFSVAKRASRSWILMASLAAVGFGVFMLVFAELSRENLPWAGVVSRLFTSLTALAIIPLIGQPFLSPGGWRRQLAPLPFIGLLMTSAVMLFGYAAISMQTVASAFIAFAPVVTVSLSWIVLKERLLRIQFVGIGIAVVGLILIAV